MTILRSIPLCRPLQPSFLSCSLFSMMPCRLRSLCVTQIHVVFAFNVDAGVMFVNFHANRSSTKSHPNKQSQDHKQHGLRLSQPISYQVNQPHKVPRFLLKVKLLRKSQLKTAQLTAHLQKLFACTGTSCLMLPKSSQAHWNSRTKIIPCCGAYKHDQ